MHCMSLSTTSNTIGKNCACKRNKQVQEDISINNDDDDGDDDSNNNKSKLHINNKLELKK